MSKIVEQDYSDSIREKIESRKYFEEAKIWYNFNYVRPFSERSYAIFLFCYTLLLLITLLINLKVLFPLNISKRYAVYSKNYKNKITITKANQINNNPILSIADLLIQKYVIGREQYDYDNLRRQFLYMQNSSTENVFNQFSQYMSINNPLSPVLRYQKSVRRNIKILSIKFPSNNSAIVKFNSIAKLVSGENFENILWQANINFEIDQININAPRGSNFNFKITNYNLNIANNNN